MIVPVPPFLPVIGYFKPHPVRVREEYSVIVVRVLRVKLRRRARYSFVGKATGDGVHGRAILDAKAEVMETGSKGVMRAVAANGPDDDAKLAIVVLDVVISFV